MYARTRQHILPDWTTSIQKRIDVRPNPKFHTALLMKGARVNIGTQGIAAIAASSTRPISKGSTLTPAENWPGAEFGAREKRVTVFGRRGETNYNYVRRINKQYLDRNRKGKFVFRAAEEIVSRSVALWVQTIVQVISEAVDKGESENG